MRIADDPGDSAEQSQFLWGALGVAAGHQDARAGVHAVGVADGLSRLGVRVARHRAGVHHDDVGRVRFGGAGVAALEQLTLDGGVVGLRGAAAEMLDVESRHSSLESTAEN